MKKKVVFGVAGVLSLVMGTSVFAADFSNGYMSRMPLHHFRTSSYTDVSRNCIRPASGICIAENCDLGNCNFVDGNWIGHCENYVTAVQSTGSAGSTGSAAGSTAAAGNNTAVSSGAGNYVDSSYSEPVYSEPVYSEPVYNEPVYNDTNNYVDPGYGGACYNGQGYGGYGYQGGHHGGGHGRGCHR